MTQTLEPTLAEQTIRAGRPLTCSEVELVTYLNMVRDVRIKTHTERPSFLVYWGTEDFLLQHGEWFTPAARPDHIQKHEDRQCFRNSILLTINEGLQYVEGFACSIIPTHHAWNTNRSRRLIDATWQEPGTAYLGVVFPKRMAVATVAYRGIALLDDYLRGFPLYRRPWQGTKRGSGGYRRGSQ